jgi:hypothetical protein
MTGSIESLLAAANKGRLLIFAGAGLSSAAPSLLPGWNDLQHQIAGALAERLEAGRRYNRFVNDLDALKMLHSQQKFPPEYQAQLIHEMCGERYFSR